MKADIKKSYQLIDNHVSKWPMPMSCKRREASTIIVLADSLYVGVLSTYRSLGHQPRLSDAPIVNERQQFERQVKEEIKKYEDEWQREMSG
jgi:hypothetical protein